MDVRWQTYEQVAAFLLDQMAEYFGVGRFEGKQVIPGVSGAQWEIDAKGCSDDGAKLLVVECKRHTTSGISQAITGSLAWTISDTGADGGILVSPLGLQAGAKKVALNAKIVEVVLDENSTTTDHFLRFLDQIVVGVSQAVFVGDFYDVEIECP
jgi:hypothetical protein